MPSQVSLELEPLMCNSFWECNDGSKINHFGQWNLASQAQGDRGFGIGALKRRNLAPVAQ